MEDRKRRHEPECGLPRLAIWDPRHPRPADGRTCEALGVLQDSKYGCG